MLSLLIAYLGVAQPTTPGPDTNIRLQIEPQKNKVRPGAGPRFETWNKICSLDAFAPAIEQAVVLDAPKPGKGDSRSPARAFKDRLLANPGRIRILLVGARSQFRFPIPADLISTCGQSFVKCGLLDLDPRMPTTSSTGESGIIHMAAITAKILPATVDDLVPGVAVFGPKGRGRFFSGSWSKEISAYTARLPHGTADEPDRTPSTEPPPPPVANHLNEATAQIRSLSGRRTSLRRQTNGRPLLVIYWATWCQPCIEEMPLLIELHARISAHISMVAVAVEGIDKATRRNVARLVKKSKLTYDQFVEREEKGTYVQLFSGGGLPAYALFDATGRLISRDIGSLATKERLAHLESELKRLMDSDGTK